MLYPVLRSNSHNGLSEPRQQGFWNTWLNMGFFGRSQLGVSYGGQNLLGYGNGDFYDRVGFQIRARILDEATNYPAIVIGIDTQGYGRWHKDLKRYTIKSTGPFIAVSKNWWSLGGNSGVHGGINYTLETEDKASVSCFFGVDKDIDNIAGIYIDYDLALADFDNDDAFGEGKGYLNASLWWQITDFFRIDILLLDMLGNGDYNSSFGRGIRVTFNDNLRKGGS